MSGSSTGPPFFEVSDLRYTDPEFRLGPVSFVLERGETLTVLGPNGSGKSTLLRLIAGLDSPTHGRIRLGDTDLTRLPAHRRRVGLVFQDLALFPQRSVRENLAYGLEARRTDPVTAAARVTELLELFHLTALSHRLPEELSGGEQQRVAVARTLAPNPELVLFDEPLSSADRVLRQELASEIRTWLSRTRTPAVYVTHDANEGLLLADRLALLRRGVWLQEGPVSEVLARPRTGFAAGFLGYNVIRLESELVAVAPSAVRLEPPGAPDSSPGRVVSVREQADGVRVVAELLPRYPRGASEHVEAFQPKGDHDASLSVNDRIGVRWESQIPVSEPGPD